MNARVRTLLAVLEATAPHHFHDEHNHVSSSPLTGEPTADLPRVLDVIAQWLDR